MAITLLFSSLLVAGIFARSAGRALPPPGNPGLSSPTLARARMVREQLMAPGRDIADPRVLAAMGSVPRHDFVPSSWREDAYADTALPIGANQTMSQPFIVAFMTSQIAPKPGERILEIGTGSGYQAAVLAELGVEVFTVEIHPALAERAADTLLHLGYNTVHCLTGDGFHGHPAAAPYDAIIVTCANDIVPPPLLDQLRVGGRLIIPLNEDGDQTLCLFHKEEDGTTCHRVLRVRFVPMTGAHDPTP